MKIATPLHPSVFSTPVPGHELNDRTVMQFGPFTGYQLQFLPYQHLAYDLLQDMKLGLLLKSDIPLRAMSVETMEPAALPDYIVSACREIVPSVLGEPLEEFHILMTGYANHCLRSMGRTMEPRWSKSMIVPWSDQTPFPFGKYKRKPLASVPADYLHWAWKTTLNGETHHELTAYIFLSINALKHEKPKLVWDLDI